MRKVLLLVLLALVGSTIIFFFFKKEVLFAPTSPLPQLMKEKPLDKYTIEALSATNFAPSEITIGKVLKDEENFTSYIFYFYPQGKKVSGLLVVPKKSGRHPVIVMFRGYIDREIYSTGIGTVRAAEAFVQNGFIAISPDFLGYGDSDNPSENPVEERFQTYIVALTLLESVKNLDSLLTSQRLQAGANSDKVFIWGHSNGGQIALTILEITGKNIPTVFWAPVSKPFPYSVLYYTDEFDDRGKMLRRVIAEFEKDYDVDKYSITGYFDKINAPLSFHQGTEDEAVPVKWSNQLVEELKKLNKDVEYFTYSGDKHNFAQGSWQTVVNRNIAFFRKYLTE